MWKVKIIVLQVVLLFISQVLNAQIKVILKLDDIGAEKNTCKALPVMEYLLEREVKASYGVIANRLDETAKPMLLKIITALDKKGIPMVEIWNHGLDHSRNGEVFEFKNSSYAQQKLHLDSSQILVKKYLGIDMHTFGAPYNATDSTCLKVIEDYGGYRKIFFSHVEVNFKTGFDRLNNNVPMEKETGKPDFEYFKEQFGKHKDYFVTNIVLQGHPPYWTQEGFSGFKKILDFLDAQHCEYVLPSSI